MTSVNDLVERLAAWLEQQPEYPVLFLADRRTRRRAARIVAYRLMTLPTASPQGMNRAETRKVVKRVKREAGRARAGLSARRQRLLLQAERNKRRYLRLQEERLLDLAASGDPIATQLLELRGAEHDSNS